VIEDARVNQGREPKQEVYICAIVGIDVGRPKYFALGPTRSHRSEVINALPFGSVMYKRFHSL